MKKQAFQQRKNRSIFVKVVEIQHFFCYIPTANITGLSNRVELKQDIPNRQKGRQKRGSPQM